MIRDVVGKLPLAPDEAYIIRSLVGHIVAGVASSLEAAAFSKFCENLNVDS